MISAEQVREEVRRLVAEFGHLQVAGACMRQLAGYGRKGADADAIAGNELLSGGALPADDEMRVSAPLRSALGKLFKAAGHQTFFAVVTVISLQYALRGARAIEVDELSGGEGEQTCAPPPCPGCRERLAAVRRLEAFRNRVRTGPLGGTTGSGQLKG